MKRMRMRWPRLPRLDVDRWDLLFAGGLGLLAYGLHQVYPPAAYVAAGMILLGVAALGARAGGAR